MKISKDNGIIQTVTMMDRVQISKLECSFISRMFKSYKNAKSMLILGEMDFSLASSIADIIEDYPNTNANDSGNNLQYFATSYHNRVNVTDLQINADTQKRVHVYMTDAIPNYKENVNLISNVKISEFAKSLRSNLLRILKKHNNPWNIVAGVDATSLDKYELFDNIKFDKIIFGFPRTKLPYDAANQDFMSAVLKSILKYMNNQSELHLLMHISKKVQVKPRKRKYSDVAGSTVRKQFDSWNILTKKVSNDEWQLVERQTLSREALKALFENYQPRTEFGFSWDPDCVEYVVLRTSCLNLNV